MENATKDDESVIAQLKLLNSRLEESEWETFRLRLRPLAESIGAYSADGIIFVSEQGLIAYLNQKAATMFGYDADELIKQPVEILIPEKLRAEHIEYRARFFKNPRNRPMGTSMGLKLFGLRKDGTEFKIGISLNPGKVNGSAVVYLICTALENNE
jgi:PAS domain S-box-containing protein